MLLPFARLGPANDLVMRASIPSLTVLAIGACLALLEKTAGAALWRKKAVLVGLLAFVSKFSVDFGQMTAAGVLALLPVCGFFFLIQRHLLQGLTAGAVKG